MLRLERPFPGEIPTTPRGMAWRGMASYRKCPDTRTHPVLQLSSTAHARAARSPTLAIVRPLSGAAGRTGVALPLSRRPGRGPPTPCHTPPPLCICPQDAAGTWLDLDVQALMTDAPDANRSSPPPRYCSHPRDLGAGVCAVTERREAWVRSDPPGLGAVCTVRTLYCTHAVPYRTNAVLY